MNLIPNSFGSFREFNTCHDDQGKFCDTGSGPAAWAATAAAETAFIDALVQTVHPRHRAEVRTHLEMYTGARYKRGKQVGHEPLSVTEPQIRRSLQRWKEHRVAVAKHAKALRSHIAAGGTPYSAALGWDSSLANLRADIQRRRTREFNTCHDDQGKFCTNTSGVKMLMRGDRVRSQIDGRTGTILSMKLTPHLTVPQWADVEWDTPHPVGNSPVTSFDTRQLDRVDTKAIADYKPERPISGPKSTGISELIPGAKATGYFKVPGLDQLHAAMGVGHVTGMTKGYEAARNTFFKKQPLEQVPFKGLVYTQGRVNTPRVKALVKATAQLKLPVFVIRSGGINYVINGHHRVLANFMAANRTITAHVFTAPG